jgi:hypothetical protein
MKLVREQQEEPCTVVTSREAYDESDSKYGDFIRVQFDGEDAPRRYTLDKNVNGSLPKEGDRVRLVLVSYMKATGARDGSGRVFYNEKRRVVDFAPVKDA